VGWTEWLVILAVVALLYRPRQFGNAVGRATGDAGSSFREGVRDGVAGKDEAARRAAAAEAERAAQLQRTRLLAVLDLPPGASAEQIRQSWRDLAKVWHPDRFAHDPALQARATTRLAAINAAYEELQRSEPSRSAPPG
jgi:Sec-independent protein translocase protein TatA